MAPHDDDLALARACSAGDEEALRRFEDELMPVARRALARFGGGTAFVADALQELRVRLLLGPHPRILAYAGTGPLTAWLKVAAVRVALNLRETNQKHQPSAFAASDDDEQTVAALNDPELEMVKLRYRDEVNAALRDAFAALTAAERSLLKLYMIDKLNIGAIGHILGKSRATVGRLVLAVRAQLLEDTRGRLVSKLGIPGPDVDSVMRLVRSRLELTLSKLLA